MNGFFCMNSIRFTHMCRKRQHLKITKPSGSDKFVAAPGHLIEFMCMLEPHSCLIFEGEMGEW